MPHHDSHRRNVKGGAIALAVGAFLPALAARALAEDCPTAGETPAAVAAIVDGDTLGLSDGSVVHLAGIEAPLPPLALPAGAPWPPAEAARTGLEHLASGATVMLALAGAAPDRYGRRHAYAFLADGRSLAIEMAAEGLVRARWFPGESGCFGAFLTAEEGAREARRGIWASPEYAVKAANDPSLLQRNGLYDLVEGRVVSVGHGSRMIFLDFGRNFRRDFTVMVPPEVADGLARAGLPVDGFANRRVRVRGIIEESGGPAIRLNDPAEIEFIDDVDQDDVGAPR